jgi:hypothetical protein
MNEARSSLIGWYRVSGFFLIKAYIVASKTRMRRTSEKAALRMKKITPTTPVTKPGWLKTSVKIRRKMAFTKLTAQIEMLKVFVLLSIHGRMTLAPIKKAASISKSATAWTVPAFCPKAMNMPLTRM